MEIRFYLQLFLRRMPVFLLVVVLCSAVGLTLSQLLPPVYVSEARLVVESEQIPGDLAASTVETAATEQMQIIRQRILSRDTLLDLANRLQIYESTRVEGRPRNADAIVDDLRERIVIETTGPDSNNRGPKVATMVDVAFRAPGAEVAASVANEVVTLILREDVAMRTGTARQTLDFFVQEVERLDKELAAKSAEILVFKQKNVSSLPENLDFNRDNLTILQERAVEMDAVITDLGDQLAALTRRSEMSDGDVDVSSPQTIEQSQLQELREQRLALTAVLSDTNPRIKLIDAQIAALDKIVAAQIGGGEVDPSGEPISALSAQMTELTDKLEAIQTERGTLEQQITALIDNISQTPVNEVALEALDREYIGIRQQYDRAVQNRATAETGDTIESLSKGQRISVIDHPTIPTKPESPNRLMVAAAGVGGGIALGVVLVGLVEILKPGIRRPVELQNKLGITAFATIPYVRTRSQSRRRHAIIIAAFAAMLIGIPLGLWMINEFVYPFLELFSRAVRQDAS